MSNLGDVLRKLGYSNVSQTGSGGGAGGYGGLGAKPPAAGRFLWVFWKNAILIPLAHISHISQPFERTIQRVQLTCSMSIFLAIF